MDFKVTLMKEAEKIGISLTGDTLAKFYEYKEMLQEFNRKTNITSLDSDEEVLYKHFLDSLTVAGCIRISAARCIDVGTGAGFPLVPVRIVLPRLKVTLLDSVNKKVDFLRELVKKLELADAECVNARAEDLARVNGQREAYDYVFSRAVAPLNVLLEYCMPFLKTGGTMIAMKSSADQEIRDAGNAFRELGAECIGVRDFDIRYCEETNRRTIIEIKKIAPTSQKYPRKAGTAKKKPL